MKTVKIGLNIVRIPGVQRISCRSENVDEKRLRQEVSSKKILPNQKNTTPLPGYPSRREPSSRPLRFCVAKRATRRRVHGASF